MSSGAQCNDQLELHSKLHLEPTCPAILDTVPHGALLSYVPRNSKHSASFNGDINNILLEQTPAIMQRVQFPRKMQSLPIECSHRHSLSHPRFIVLQW
jgi:hypothetical protein